MTRLLFAALIMLSGAAIAPTAFAQASDPRSAPQSAPESAPESGPQSSAPGAHAPATPEMRAARKAMREACAADVAKLCPTAEPGHGAVMTCMRTHRREVSEGCASAMRGLREARMGRS